MQDIVRGVPLLPFHNEQQMVLRELGRLTGIHSSSEQVLYILLRQQLLPTGYFYTMDDTAIAFARETYEKTQYIRHEFGSLIYSRDLFGIQIFSYTEPYGGNPHVITVLQRVLPEGTVWVAFAHTHPNSNEFSGLGRRRSGDVKVAHYYGVDFYVIGPNQILQRYSITTEIVTEVGRIIPKPLTGQERILYEQDYQKSWEEHFSIDNWGVRECDDFGCHLMTWPTP